ncbi:MAG: hypothetical protein LM580_05585 [Thermofilum sp.]|nr:hypothetical protein [Thermofilum sp.]MCC6065191.1 hypothetical protein [Thermofilum sp.]
MASGRAAAAGRPEARRMAATARMATREYVSAVTAFEYRLPRQRRRKSGSPRPYS